LVWLALKAQVQQFRRSPLKRLCTLATTSSLGRAGSCVPY
jgi:hypothetical protein